MIHNEICPVNVFFPRENTEDSAGETGRARWPNVPVRAGATQDLSMESQLSHLRSLGARRRQDGMFCFAWHFAKSGNGAGLRCLALERAPLGRVGAGGINLLHLAAKSGDLESVQILLDWGISPQEPSEHGFTPLHWAAFSERSGPLAAREIGAAGGDPLARDYFGLAPMHWAGNEKIISWFAARLWALGTGQESLALPGGLTWAEGCEALGNAAAAAWIRADRREVPGGSAPKSFAEMFREAKAARESLERLAAGCGCQAERFPV